MLTESQMRGARAAQGNKRQKVDASGGSTGLIKTNKIAYRKLANGKTVKSVDEQYLRKDLPCGLKKCPVCDVNISK
jgi:hypothetical protein